MKIEIDVGKTSHSQSVVLVATQQSNGTWLYELVKHAAAQRDDTVHMPNLTDETMAAICAAYLKTKALAKA
ncbi:MAG: hypothetical protein JNK17_02035 [Hydrogenophaga sp.]|nr:hypothetical protein [Hydrogenophaga sp.]